MSLIDQYEIDRSLIPILFEMEKTGIYVHRKKLEREYIKCNLEIQKIDREFTHYGIKNIQSPKELIHFLLDVLKLHLWERTKPSKTHPDGQLKTDAAAIRRYEQTHNLDEKQTYWLHKIQQRAALKTARGYFANYLDFLCLDDILHPSFNVGFTNTFRLSSSNPNLQNVTSKLTSQNPFTIDGRQMFGPRPGYLWVSMDFSQIELRLYAHCSQEPKMLEVYNSGGDLHDFTRTSINYLNSMEKGVGRKLAKNTNFTTIYEGTPWTLYYKYGMPTSQGEKCITGFWNTYTTGRIFNDKSYYSARSNGEITTIFNRKLQIPYNNGRLKAKTTAVNYQIQSPAADLMKLAMIRIAKFLKKIPSNKCRMLLTVHDELVFEIAKDFFRISLLKKLRELMEDHGGLICIPTPVDIALITNHWGKKVELKI